MPFHNGHNTINRLVESVPENISIVIVDDHSDIALGSLPYKNVTILKSNRRGYFAGAVNVGIKYTRGDVLILNQDTYFEGTGWITQLQTALEKGFSYIGESITGTREDWPNSYIHGTYMYLTREAIDKTGLLNKELFPMWGCTAEYQLRVARNNLRILPLKKVDDFVHIREGAFGESFQKLFKEEPENKNLFVQTPPLVSVIIPTHNYSKYLESTVNCLIGGKTDLGHFPQQTFASFEVVIVDDSSTDETPQIINSLVDGWKGVRSIRLDRPRSEVWDSEKDKYIGKVVAVNEGIKSSNGRYILTLDADDMMHSNRIERLFAIQDKNRHSFVYDDLQYFSDGKITTYTYPDYYLEVNDTATGYKQLPHPQAGKSTDKPKMVDYDLESLIYKNTVHSSIMFPKHKDLLYPERFKYGREDWAMAVKLGVNGFHGIRDKNNGFLYRRHGGNRTLVNTNSTWMSFFQKQMVEEFGHLYKHKQPLSVARDNWV